MWKCRIDIWEFSNIKQIRVKVKQIREKDKYIREIDMLMREIESCSIKDMQTLPSPLSSEVVIFTLKIPTVLNRMKNKLSDFYLLSYGWLYKQCSSVLPQFPSVTPTKKIVQKLPNLQERCAILWNGFFSSQVFFVLHSVFEIWSILYVFGMAIASLFGCRTPHVCKIDHIQTRSYHIKSHKKNSVTKNHF